jgi:hypothetical protein
MGPSLALFPPKTVHQPKEYCLIETLYVKGMTAVFFSTQVTLPGICLGYYDLRTGERWCLFLAHPIRADWDFT